MRSSDGQKWTRPPAGASFQLWETIHPKDHDPDQFIVLVDRNETVYLVAGKDEVWWMELDREQVRRLHAFLGGVVK